MITIGIKIAAGYVIYFSIMLLIASLIYFPFLRKLTSPERAMKLATILQAVGLAIGIVEYWLVRVPLGEWLYRAKQIPSSLIFVGTQTLILGTITTLITMFVLKQINLRTFGILLAGNFSIGLIYMVISMLLGSAPSPF